MTTTATSRFCTPPRETCARRAVLLGGLGTLAAACGAGGGAHRTPVSGASASSGADHPGDPAARADDPSAVAGLADHDVLSPAERADREARARALLDEHGLDALWLRRVSSFGWATGASGYINTATDFGVGSLLVTRQQRYLLTSNIEAPRFEREDGLRAQGWEPVVENWWEPGEALARLTRGLRVGSDAPAAGVTDLSDAMARVRSRMSPPETARMRALCALGAAAMDAAVRRVRPGQTEHQIASLLAQESTARGVGPIVNLVATDQRIRDFRHPLPTDKRLERHAMVVLCGRRWGLICALTRFVYFGRLPDELRRRQQATARVDATFLTATRPGVSLREVFARATARYAAEGFADEWHRHHQGGAIAYEPREFLGTPGSSDTVSAGQAYAWNPSITGTKSEDTMLVTAAGDNAVLTAIAGWPAVEAEVDGHTVRRPAVLEVT